MAPIRAGRTDKEKRVTVLLCKSPSQAEDVESAGLPFTQAFTHDIQHQLPAAVSSRSSGSLLHEIEKAIATFPGNLGTPAASKCEEIDSAGTVLWNLCTRLRRDVNPGSAQESPPAITDIARVFAFLLLCCAHDHGKSATSNSLRLMKIGNKAAKNCLSTSTDGHPDHIR